jgi:chorismate synthase
MFGSQHNDAIEDISGKTRTNHAGGVVGGLTNNELVFRIAIKPTSSTPRANNIKLGDRKIEPGSQGPPRSLYRTESTVILEAVTAIVLADLMLLEQNIKRILS